MEPMPGLAELYWVDKEGKEHKSNLEGERIDQKIIEKIDWIRENLGVMKRTHMVIGKGDYIYEYDDEGHVENVIENGAVTP